MELHIRAADEAEAEAIAELHLRTAIEGYGHIFPAEAPKPMLSEVLAQWQQWLGPDRAIGRRVFVAETNQGGPLLGVVIAGPDLDEDGAGHLARLYVLPERWGGGIGRSLYDAAMDHMGAAGYRHATLWVLEHNHRARSWYERLGWVATGERKATYAPAGIDDLRYRRALAR